MSTKDKTNTKVIEQPTATKPAESTSHPIFGAWVQQTKDVWQSCKNTTKEYLECDTIKEIQRRRRQFYNLFCHPLGNLYRSFPEDLTTLKFNLIGKYDYHQRLVALQAATLLIALSSLKVQPNVGYSQRMLFAFRNSAIFFALGGLLVAPEIYNSLVKSDF